MSNTVNTTFSNDSIDKILLEWYKEYVPSETDVLRQRIDALEEEIQRLKKKDFACYSCLEKFCNPQCKYKMIQSLDRVAYIILNKDKINKTDKKIFIMGASSSSIDTELLKILESTPSCKIPDRIIDPVELRNLIAKISIPKEFLK